MISVNEAKRLIKRTLLANIVSDKPNLALTPLVSGKHGIGKSAMIKSIAQDLGGVCITVEGGTLKEGEITGLPYQYKDEDGKELEKPINKKVTILIDDQGKTYVTASKMFAIQMLRFVERFGIEAITSGLDIKIIEKEIKGSKNKGLGFELI